MKSNIARRSKFNINVNFKKSKGLYLHDNNTNKKYLDFFGMYASLPIGYNHSIFNSTEFKEEIINASKTKINNCEFVSDETLEFDKLFTSFANKSDFKNFHYTCTGALAVEAAIKTCIHASKYEKPKIVTFKNSFHGINSFSCFITDRFFGADKKLDLLPETFSTKLDADYETLKDYLAHNFVTCVIVEPIQCSAGDIHLDFEFYKKLRELCDKHNVPLIFDEIQVGFGSTGKMWFYEHTDIVPDIVIFGKKTQLSGIMVNEKYSGIFDENSSTRLEVTWDGDVVDMIRCKYIMRAYEKYNIVENTAIQGEALLEMLKSVDKIKNPRARGLIAAFDMENQIQRDKLVKKLYKNGMIVNKTGKKSIRLRPSLNVESKHIAEAERILKKSLLEVERENGYEN
tara:strand:+ start:575 stop:1774 length:1200 start_codon:yes stop_codon:yes gene_type:complete